MGIIQGNKVDTTTIVALAPLRLHAIRIHGKDHHWIKRLNGSLYSGGKISIAYVLALSKNDRKGNHVVYYFIVYKSKFCAARINDDKALLIWIVDSVHLDKYCNLHAADCIRCITVTSAQIKENNKAPRHWPLLGQSTGDQWIPLTKGQ